jgi:iron(III) transport system substrate-binding protein
VLAAACAVAAAQPAGAAPASPVDDPALVARAKQEGSVSFYGALTEVQLRAIAQRFESAYGIKVNVLRMESTALPARVLTEERSGRHEIDVVSDGGFQMEALGRQGLLAVFRPPENADLIVGAVDPDGYWSSTVINTETIAYNPVRLRALGIKPPRTWEDLAGPEWRGRFGLFAGSYEWYAAMKRYYGQERADRLMRAYAANQPHMLGSKQSGISLIEAGDLLAAPNLYGYDALNEKRKGEPIDFSNPTPTFIELYGVAVVKTAPHPNAARLMERWWLSRDTQRWQRATLGRISPRKDVANDPELLNAKVHYAVSNPADAVDYDGDVKTFNEIFNIPG